MVHKGARGVVAEGCMKNKHNPAEYNEIHKLQCIMGTKKHAPFLFALFTLLLF